MTIQSSAHVDFEFLETKRPPKGARKVAYIEENDHTFYKKDKRLFMRNCVGDFLEVFGHERYDYDKISDDFELLEDYWELGCR